MDTELFELKNTVKELIKNLIIRTDTVASELDNDENTERLMFWLQDLSILTEGLLNLKQYNVFDIEIELFNEKAEILLNRIDEKDFIYVADFLLYEMKPLLSYWDGCITND